MATERKIVHRGTFAAEIEDFDLGIGDTTVISRLGIWLILAVAVATCGTTTHLLGGRNLAKRLVEKGRKETVPQLSVFMRGLSKINYRRHLGIIQLISNRRSNLVRSITHRWGDVCQRWLLG